MAFDLLVFIEHLRGVKNVSANIDFQLIFQFLLLKKRNPEINQNSLLVVTYDNILRLDIPMYDFDNVMAVMKSFDHVKEIVS